MRDGHRVSQGSGTAGSLLLLSGLELANDELGVL
jgi:hypothetical protein